MKISGLKRAVGDYKRANEGGCYSPRYGYMMLDRNTGELWVDEFCDIGHNWRTDYHDPAVINLGWWSQSYCGLFENSMRFVKEISLEAIKEWQKERCAC